MLKSGEEVEQSSNLGHLISTIVNDYLLSVSN